MASRTSVALWTQRFQRSPESNMSLQGQIRQMLVAAILDGQLLPNHALPSSRELADQLSVARNTVVLAYQQLVEEGYLLSRERSGHFVNPAILEGRHEFAPLQTVPEQAANEALARPDWDQRVRRRPSSQRNIVKPGNWLSYEYPFIYGQFDQSLFPTNDWRECCMKALSVMEIRNWAPDLIERDDDTLIQQIRTRVLPRRGVFAMPDEIVVTIGCQQALYLIADLLASERTTIGFENPGYPDARNIFENRNARLQPLPVDSGGVRPVEDADLLAQCDYVYVTPSHQCPTTATMPIERRHALLEQAQAHDFVLIEDDYESENNFSGTPHPALKSLDTADRVIYIGPGSLYSTCLCHLSGARAPRCAAAAACSRLSGTRAGVDDGARHAPSRSALPAGRRWRLVLGRRAAMARCDTACRGRAGTRHPDRAGPGFLHDGTGAEPLLPDGLFGYQTRKDR